MSKTTRRSPLTALLKFLGAGSAGGVLLIISGVTAMTWANSAFRSAYFDLLRIHIGSHDVSFWVNEGLMALFFLLVGLELRREMTVGELASPSRLAAPAIAALGGMVVPAVIFSLFNYQDRVAMRGWAVPVATDIVFALAVLSIFGRRIPTGLTVFLTALAIIDDLGAIVVIAVFYSGHLHLGALGGAIGLILALWGLNKVGVRALSIFLLGGGVLWLLVLNSGVHATLSGVALAFVIPAETKGAIGNSPALFLERRLEMIVAYVVLPLFGLVNSGLSLGSLPIGLLTEPLFLGVLFGLVVGKQAGVFGSVLLANRLGLAVLPSGVSKLQLYGASIICGIGFTMSLFIGDLAFGDSFSEGEVKLAVFVGSIVSALLGVGVLAGGSYRKR